MKSEYKGKRLLNIKETAKYLGIAPGTIYNSISRKTKHPFPIKVKRFRGKPLFDIRDLETYVDSM